MLHAKGAAVAGEPMILSDGRYVANVVDGKVTLYGRRTVANG
jgi:hypothetical protein